MDRSYAGPRTLVFWGAGATKALGIRTTTDQGKFIHTLADVDSPSKPLEARVDAALAHSNREPWRAALVDLIRILGDRDDSYRSIHAINESELETMGRNWKRGAGKEELERRIIELRLTYDWPALKSAVCVCPGARAGNIKLNDLFNLLDMHIPSGFGFRGPAGAGDSQRGTDRLLKFFDARRLIGREERSSLATDNFVLRRLSGLHCLETRRIGKIQGFCNTPGAPRPAGGAHPRADRRVIRSSGILSRRPCLREPQLRSDPVVGAMDCQPGIEP